MVKLVEGKKYRLINLGISDEWYSNRGRFIGRTFTYDGNYVFEDGEVRSFISNGLEAEECCVEGCCETPPRNAEFATMELEEQELDFRAIKPAPVNEKIEQVFVGLHDLLQYKNSKYGNSGIEPINVFSKVSAETGLLQRLDDKIARIKNSPELRKNDVADVVGYLVLLCVTKGWTNFDEFKD